MLTACAASPVDNDKHNGALNFHILASDDKQPHTYYNLDKTWEIDVSLIQTQAKPKTYFYDFTIRSSQKAFTVQELKFKFGAYGKWRNIKPDLYLDKTATENPSQNISLKNFPITIKKTGLAHHQTLNLTVIDAQKQQQQLNLIFGVNKCISRNEKEFLCF